MGNKFGPQLGEGFRNLMGNKFRERAREFRRTKRRALVSLRKGTLSMGEEDEYRYDLIQLAIEEEFPTVDIQRDSIGLIINVPWPGSRRSARPWPVMNIIDIEMFEDCIMQIFVCGATVGKTEVPISNPEAFKKVFDFLREGGLE